MNIAAAKEELIRTVAAYTAKDARGNYKIPVLRQRPILLIGPPGIGKTAIVAQAAAKCNVGCVAYTLTHHTRQSAVGLPMVRNREYQGISRTVTEYTMSEILASVYAYMEETKETEGILFLDEINCVSETLVPTMLQFLQNKTFGTHRIPRGWILVAAGNPQEYNRSARAFDIVTLDRVRCIQVEADVRSWLSYASGAGIHGAVVSYLNVKPSNFYYIEQHAAEKEFVTARGWEDLSVVLREYEEMGFPVDENLSAQFLQCEEIARDFTEYYRLYRRYRTGYDIPGLLAGNIPQSDLEEKTRMLREAQPDEKFAVVQMLYESLLPEMEAYGLRRQDQRRSEEILGQIESLRHQDSGGTKPDLFLETFVERFERSRHIKEENGLLDGEDAARDQRIQYQILNVCYELRSSHEYRWEQASARLKEALKGKDSGGVEQMAGLEKKIQNAFALLENGDGDGMCCRMFAEHLISNADCAAFLKEHRIPVFLRCLEDLNLYDQEQALRAQAGRYLGET